jgi:hypothetical protein
MRIAILCNGRALKRWQARAVDLIADGNELYLLACAEVPTSRNVRKHGLYYALNAAAIRNRMTRPVPIAASFAGRLDFQPEFEGAWASFPADVLAWLRDNRIDAIIKFGLGLLRIPDGLEVPILSYHHGNPEVYRGRPAGFYELLHGAGHVGQIVQILSNRLDAGEILAFGETAVVKSSYRKTLIAAYGLSPYLLAQALKALREGERVAIEPTGRAYRLPDNATVARFVLARAWSLLRSGIYGAFFEKRWNVSRCSADGDSDLPSVVAGVELREWITLPVERPFTFLADPFFLTGTDDIVVEAMNGRSGKGELLRHRHGAAQRIGGARGHISYPGSIAHRGEIMVVPETADWAPPALYRVADGMLEKIADLDIDATAMLDPTLHEHDGRVYLFGNRADEGPSVLRLWVADDPFGRFEEHPDSPIRLSIRGGRMGGAIASSGGRLFRVGQDVRTSYGDGVRMFEIIELSPERYREREVGSLGFSRVHGPHTVNIRDGVLLFDWYTNRFSIAAGFRRFLNRL